MESEKYSESLNSDIHNELLFPAYIWPSVAYFNSIPDDAFMYVPVFEKFKKQSEYTRYSILTSQGSKKLIIPVKAGKTTLPICEVKISYDFDWQRQHWRTIRSAYGSAPYFEHFSPLLYELYQHKFEYLHQLNIHILKRVFQWLGKNVQLAAVFSLSDLRPSIPRLEMNAHITPYLQVFSNRFPFNEDVSILDKILNAGF